MAPLDPCGSLQGTPKAVGGTFRNSNSRETGPNARGRCCHPAKRRLEADFDVDNEGKEEEEIPEDAPVPKFGPDMNLKMSTQIMCRLQMVSVPREFLVKNYSNGQTNCMLPRKVRLCQNTFNFSPNEWRPPTYDMCGESALSARASEWRRHGGSAGRNRKLPVMSEFVLPSFRN